MTADTFVHSGVTVEIHHDEDCASPRENDNLTVIVGSHRSYVIGDGEPDGRIMEALERGGWRLAERYMRVCMGAVYIAPLGMIDHFGVSFYLGGGAHWSDALGWDSGTVGVVYITEARIHELCGDGAEYRADEWLAEAARGEVEEYDRWARGDCYGYVVAAGTEDEDSCWGFIGYDYCVGEAKALAEWVAARVAERAVETQRTRRALASSRGRAV